MDNLLLSSLESAFVSLLTTPATALGATVYPGMASSTKAGPCVICAADGDSADEDPPFMGNFWVDVEVAVKGTAATEPGALTDPKDTDLLLVRAVYNTVKVDNLDALLNAQGQNLTVLPRAYFFGSPKAGRDAQGVFVNVLPIKIYCCASVLAP